MKNNKNALGIAMAWLMAFGVSISLVAIYLYHGELGLKFCSVQKIIFALCYPVAWLEYRLILLIGGINKNQVLQRSFS